MGQWILQCVNVSIEWLCIFLRVHHKLSGRIPRLAIQSQSRPLTRKLLNAALLLVSISIVYSQEKNSSDPKRKGPHPPHLSELLISSHPPTFFSFLSPLFLSPRSTHFASKWIPCAGSQSALLTEVSYHLLSARSGLLPSIPSLVWCPVTYMARTHSPQTRIGLLHVTQYRVIL